VRRTVIIIVAAALGGCSLFHDSYPDKSCEANGDCFSGREVCNPATRRCESIDVPDAGPPPVDAGPQPDAPQAPDAGRPDARLPDAEVPDAT